MANLIATCHNITMIFYFCNYDSIYLIWLTSGYHTLHKLEIHILVIL